MSTLVYVARFLQKLLAYIPKPISLYRFPFSLSLFFATNTFLTSTMLYPTAIFFLEGTSRSGKSSIGNAIKKHKNWSVVGSVYFDYCLQEFNLLFPELFACIKNGIEENNIRHAVTRNMFVFKKNIQENDKKLIINAAEKIQKQFADPAAYAHHKKKFSQFSLNKIEKCITHGLHVLADVGWYVTQKDIQTLKPKPSVYHVLAYCPLDKVIDRLIQRNQICLETGMIMNYRFFIEPLLSFMSLYELKTEKQKSIDTIEKSTILTCLDIIEKYLTKKLEEPQEAKQSEAKNFSLFIMQEFTHQEFIEYRSAIAEKFKNHEILYVIPKKPYNLIIRTDQHTPHKCAQQVIDYIETQK